MADRRHAKHVQQRKGISEERHMDRGEVLRLKANEKLGFTGEERQKLDAKIEGKREAIGFTGEKRKRLTETEYNQEAVVHYKRDGRRQAALDSNSMKTFTFGIHLHLLT